MLVELVGFGQQNVLLSVMFPQTAFGTEAN